MSIHVQYSLSPSLLPPGVLAQVVGVCVAGAMVMDVCETGDKLIIQETSSVYKKEKDMKKGELVQLSSLLTQLHCTSLCSRRCLVQCTCTGTCRSTL